METVIQVKVIDKHAIVVGEPVIVCGNSGYFVEFDFDEEWEGQEARTARFAYVRRGAVQYQDRVFTGNRVEVPVLTSVAQVRVGVFAGNLCTTTPAVVPCEYSIRCNTGAPEDPTPDQYDQIMELLRLNSAVTSVNGQTGDVQTRLLVTITANEDGTYTSSHTPQEIYSATQAGAVVEASDANGRRYSLYACNEMAAQFLAMGVRGSSGKRILYTETFVISGDKVGKGTTETPIPVAPVPMVGATASAAGTAGLVPAPAAGDGGKFLRGDGTWGEIAIPEGGGGGDEWDVHHKINIASVLESGFEITEVDGQPLQLKEMYAMVKIQNGSDVQTWMGCTILGDTDNFGGNSANKGGVYVNSGSYAYYVYHIIVLPNSGRVVLQIQASSEISGNYPSSTLIQGTNRNWLGNWLEHYNVNYIRGISCAQKLGSGTSQGYGTEIEIWGKSI